MYAPLSPLVQWVGKGREFDLVLNEICAHRVGNLTFVLNTCLLHQILEVGVGFDQPALPNSAFEFWSVKSHPSPPTAPGGDGRAYNF